MKKLSTMLLAFGLICVALPAFAQYETINNDTWWKDASGNPIFAQGGGISKFGSTYYWYGTQSGGAVSYYNTGTANSDYSFIQINCYTSTDLVHWTKQNPPVTTNTANFSSSEASGVSIRGQSVFYNSSSKLYFMEVAYSGTLGTGIACLTCSTPTGNFVWDHLQTNFPNVYNSPGDISFFVDVDHGSVPYMLCSDSHGREHAYISTLSSDYKTINAATLISEWSQGQEANNMFERNGVYYYNMSNLAGWSYSYAWSVWSTSILTPSDYTGDAQFPGTPADFTHHTQIDFGVEVAGTELTNYFVMGDRWADFDDSYQKAGLGSGYYEWCPVTFSGETPTYNSAGSFQIDAATGQWQTTPGLANGTYAVLNLHSGLELDAFEQGKTNGTPVDQWAWNGGQNQEWTVTSLGSGKYSIVGVQSGLYLNSPSSTKGAQLNLESSNGSTSLAWVIAPAATPGYYTVQCVANSYLMDDYENATTNGTTTDQWSSNGGANQEWSFSLQ